MGQKRKIICAVDFSPVSDEVLAYAAALQRDGAELTLLHVEHSDSTQCALKKRLHAFSRYSAILARERGTTAFSVRYGDPATEILTSAREENADLLVLGSHGSMAFTRLLMGSTAETVMRRARCPVIVYKSPETGGMVPLDRERSKQHIEQNQQSASNNGRTGNKQYRN